MSEEKNSPELGWPERSSGVGPYTITASILCSDFILQCYFFDNRILEGRGKEKSNIVLCVPGMDITKEQKLYSALVNLFYGQGKSSGCEQGCW